MGVDAAIPLATWTPSTKSMTMLVDSSKDAAMCVQVSASIALGAVSVRLAVLPSLSENEMYGLPSPLSPSWKFSSGLVSSTVPTTLWRMIPPAVGLFA